MRTTNLTLLALLLAGSAFLSACGESITLPATGTIYGDLVWENGNPASGVSVVVEGLGLTAVSDLRGRFVIQGALAVDEEGMGKYYVVRGYGERDGVPIGFLVDHFKVKGQQSYSVGTVVVPPTGTIRGYVNLDATGDDSGVRIRIEGTSLETISRTDGSYILERVPGFEGYRLHCSHEGYVEATLDTAPDFRGEPAPIVVYPRETTQLAATTLRRSTR